MIFIEVPQSALFLLFDSNSIAQGMTREAPGGARLELGRMPMEKRGGLTLDTLPMVTMLVSFAGGVAVNVFSAWLYEKLKSDKMSQHVGITKIRIDRKEVAINPEAITRIVTESIEVEIKKK
jgi:hypothetical protein